MNSSGGVKVTAHRDLNQDDILEHLRQAIVDLKVDRIDHGGNILQSPELIQLAKQRNLFFTVCPSFSGRATGTGKPLDVVRGMLDQGLNFSINSDDPAYMGSEYLTEVLVRAQVQNSLTERELVQIERNAFNAAWIPEGRRAHFVDRLDAFARTWGVA